MIRLGAAFAFMLLAGGCSPKTRPAKFYLLQPISKSEALIGTMGKTSPNLIGVGPIDIPAYLDRPQIVSGGDGAQLQMDEFERWAEPLRDNFTRTMAENLSLLMPSSHVMPFPWNRAITPDYQVEIQVTRFHVDVAGNNELKANWSILKQNKPLLLKEFHARNPVGGGDYEAKVAAQSRAVGEFSREIAQALQSVQLH